MLNNNFSTQEILKVIVLLLSIKTQAIERLLND